MTIVTKPLSEKKVEKPLVGGDIKVDIVVPERSGPQIVPLKRTNDFRTLVREKRVRSASTAFLFLTALLVMGCGIITGLYLYRTFVRVQMEKFHLRCSIPYSVVRYGDQSAQSLESDSMMGELDNKVERYFHEDFEIDDNYEKITVPDFSGGRKSKFIHDFRLNVSGIIDISGRRCFVMPLNRTLVLPPRTLKDLVQKMRNGYYEVDTGYVRETMQVITPAVEDRTSLGHYIEQECLEYPIYKLEKMVSRVYKRSAEPEVKFMEFAGKKTHELFIVNYNELQEHEEMPIAMA